MLGLKTIKYRLIKVMRNYISRSNTMNKQLISSEEKKRREHLLQVKVSNNYFAPSGKIKIR